MRKIRNSELTQYLRMGISTTRAKLVVQASFWIAAVFVGVMAVYFSQWIEWLQQKYLGIAQLHPVPALILTPAAFVAAAGVCRRFEPNASGSGIPQVLHAVHISAQTRKPGTLRRLGILSIRTSVVKFVSCSIGFFGGASIGGEGPTVQISASIFSSIGHWMRRYFPNLDFQSYLVAGAGAGIAAAFNTPLGGLVFALEEVAVGEFGALKHLVMIGVIVAGMCARAIMGNELYFGDPRVSAVAFQFIGWALITGIIGGVLGGLFGRLVASDAFGLLNRFEWKARALICGVAVSLIGLIYSGTTAGSGYLITRNFFEGRPERLPALTFPLAKLLATALSTLSGMGGGILAPSLSIGAWMGTSLATIGAHLSLILNFKACSILGMVAFFSGAYQIPMTAVIIVMEMTNEHDLIFPMMIAGVIAFITAKVIMPQSLYHVIIDKLFKGEFPGSGPGFEHEHEHENENELEPDELSDPSIGTAIGTAIERKRDSDKEPLVSRSPAGSESQD